MNEEIMRILKMVEESKISAEEGGKLIEAIENLKSSGDWIDLNEENGDNPEDFDIPETGSTGRKPSWLYVIVDGKQGGKKKVRIRVPIKLARWALKFAPKSATAHMKEEFGEDFSMKDIEQILDELPVGTDLVNVIDDEKGENVRIFLR